MARKKDKVAKNKAHSKVAKRKSKAKRKAVAFHRLRKTEIEVVPKSRKIAEDVGTGVMGVCALVSAFSGKVEVLSFGVFVYVVLKAVSRLLR